MAKGGLFGMMGLGGIGDALSGIPILGPLLGGRPEQEQQQKAFANAIRAYEKYRPMQMQAYQDLLGSARGAYTPSRQVLGQLFGGNAGQGLQALSAPQPNPQMMAPPALAAQRMPAKAPLRRFV
jgi:hypothetical protein